MSRAVVGFVAPLADGLRPLVLDEATGGPRPGRFFMAVEGEATAPLRLGAGDVLVVDTAVVPQPGALVVADVDGMLVLVPWDSERPVAVFGVVTHALVEALRRRRIEQ